MCGEGVDLDDLTDWFRETPHSVPGRVYVLSPGWKWKRARYLLPRSLGLLGGVDQVVIQPEPADLPATARTLSQWFDRGAADWLLSTSGLPFNHKDRPILKHFLSTCEQVFISYFHILNKL